MATATQIILTTTPGAAFSVSNITEESAARASKVLQENHEQHDIIFNNFGFHNHIVHHILTAFALGATSDTLQKLYDKNISYQRPLPPLEPQTVTNLEDPKAFLNHLNKITEYHNYLAFFTKKIDQYGYEHVINTYLFKGDEVANVMFCRMFAGFLHPMIHLGFGVEFRQPAIVAEALAQAAIHPAWLDPFLLAVESAAKGSPEPALPFVELLDAIRADTKLSTAAHWDDNDKVRDGIMVRAPEEMIKYASRWRVEPGRLEEATAEMTNAAVYFTGGAQHPPKQIKFDFYLIHAVNCSIFFSSFLAQPWISTTNKVKLVEWNGRLGLTLYASRRSPQPLMNEITEYVPKIKLDRWGGVLNRAAAFEDDGHTCKLVRALAHGEQISKKWEKSERFRVKGRMWLQLGNMVIDSVEDTGEHWVRSAGFEEAWKDYTDRPSTTTS